MVDPELAFASVTKFLLAKSKDIVTSDVYDRQYSKFFARFPTTDEYKINSALKSNALSIDDCPIIFIKYLRFKPDAICGLRLSWDSTNAHPEECFHLGSWWLDDGSIKYLGYRFESPNTGDDNHSYYHAQPCKNFGDRGREFEGNCHPSNSFPTFGINATNRLELLLQTLLSLSGKDQLREWRNEIDDLFDNLSLRQGALRDAFNRLLD